MTLTTVGYGDISADNTGERAGYVLFFIVGAFIWGNLLAEVGEIHQTSSARQHEEMERIQTMLEFLMDNDCPSQLRTEIIQWTRYATCVLSSGLTLSQGLLLFLMLFRLSLSHVSSYRLACRVQMGLVLTLDAHTTLRDSLRTDTLRDTLRRDTLRGMLRGWF